MIQTIRCPDTAALIAGKRVVRFMSLEKVARRKLAMLHRAQTLNDLRDPPNNRLEALQRELHPKSWTPIRPLGCFS
jgi:proteic killer suppression protein